MSHTAKKTAPDAAEQVEPFRLIVTFKTGISLSLEINITKRQQLLLHCLAEHVDTSVSETQLLGLAYGEAGAANAVAFSEEMHRLGERLASVLGDVMRRTPDGYQLVTDKVWISFPYRD